MLGAWLYNTAGMKEFKRVRPKDLFPLEGDETLVRNMTIDPEERRKQALKTLAIQKSKDWMKLRGPSLDEVEIFGRKDLERIKEKYRKDN